MGHMSQGMGYRLVTDSLTYVVRSVARGHRIGYRCVTCESYMGHRLSYRWVKHCYIWVSNESLVGFAFEYISHLLRNYESLTPSQLYHISDKKMDVIFDHSEESNPVVSPTTFL